MDRIKAIDIFKNLENIARERKGLHATPPKRNSYIWKSPIKNKEIKEAFAKKAPDYECQCRPDIKKREWLYDLVWRKFDSGDYLSTLLAMEIEVSAGYKGVVYDFNKLLQSDAKLKIMVFQQKTVEEGEDILNKLNSPVTTLKTLLLKLGSTTPNSL